ncbi:MAG: hypothetical protein K0R61_5103 [Microvirga sp.]|jgi:hypothetical protein|nr:hypothetical protein [Microvirga sp.]
MDEAGPEAPVTSTHGEIKALEDQIRVLLAVMVNAGVEPGTITSLLGRVRAPDLEPEAGAAYTRGMDSFRAAIEAFADKKDKAKTQAGIHVAE